ncbi:hypothetical protein CYLTODRAFT_458713 [Cylindrobasidium torrendii FP15055 ss-10]|uniref:Uncharacterized protein n=1 Tax=Cylindrobasidium torrendii FP15055 ss-10 TaxID=1314674 RepID=A0A0D7AX39_9AGAR|nr:hypothetical protein CYLTODRAFT_458713 [Cylindrobasidium torrendii FP15055 ss-10]
MHALEERRHQRALNDDLLIWCLVIKPYFPSMYKDILGELGPWMQDIPLHRPPTMTKADFDQVVVCNSGVAERQSAWEEDNGEALRGLVQLVLAFKADVNPLAPKRSALDRDDEAEPPANIHAHGNAISASALTAGPPRTGAPHGEGDLATTLRRQSLMALTSGQVPRVYARAEHEKFAKYLAGCPEWQEYLSERGAARPGA